MDVGGPKEHEVQPKPRELAMSTISTPASKGQLLAGGAEPTVMEKIRDEGSGALTWWM